MIKKTGKKKIMSCNQKETSFEEFLNDYVNVTSISFSKKLAVA